MESLVNASRAIVKTVVSVATTARAGQHALHAIVGTAMRQVRQIQHNGHVLTFHVPHRLNQVRANTFAIKEPETLEWLDSLPRGCILWDVGANVGLYSCYAAGASRCSVYASELSVLNLEVLARNIHRNSLADQITILPLPLTDRSQASRFKMTSTDCGGGLSTLDQNYGYDTQPLDPKLVFNTQGMTMDDTVNLLNISQPDYIKMDVDGFEHLILSGGRQVISRVKGILVEVNDDFEEQAETTAVLLSEAGFTFMWKRHSDLIERNTSGFARIFNQAWQRAQEPDRTVG